MKNRSNLKDDLTWELQRNWIVEIHVKKNLATKRFFSITVTSIYGIKDKYIIIKYYALNLIPRKIKLRFEDIDFIKGKIKRKKIINNVDFLKITQLKKSTERKQMLRKTLFYKWTLIILIILAVAGASIGFAMLFL